MSLACGAECVVCVGCSRWMWKRCTYVGSDDSATWPLATREELEPIPRICRVILAVYEEDLSNPKYAPAGGYRMDASCVVKRVTYEQTQGCAPPYIIYVDHAAQEIIMAIRGLNLVKESDYKLLLDNRLGQQMFDGGYVHHGLLKSAVWILNQESETLKRLWLENGKRYKMVFLGHSLGSGVAALLAIVVVNHREKLGGMPRNLVRCYAVAPARCVSLNLAVKYADILHSVILQDDFLPRTPTPLEDIFGSIFCLPCLMFLICLRDTFLPEHRKLRDPRRLYAPGRMYHIVERKFCRGHALCIQAVQKVNVAMYMTHLRNQLALFIRCGRYPPEVRTAIPVEGRFEHIVLSCNATSDHAIIWIEREAQKALDRMKESSQTTTPPLEQRMVRQETLEKEHVAALEKAVSLNVPHAATPTEETGEESVATTSHDQNEGSMLDQDEGSPRSESKSSTRTNWDEMVEKLFTRSESGHLVLKKDINIVQ